MAAPSTLNTKPQHVERMLLIGADLVETRFSKLTPDQQRELLDGTEEDFESNMRCWRRKDKSRPSVRNMGDPNVLASFDVSGSRES